MLYNILFTIIGILYLIIRTFCFLISHIIEYKKIYIPFIFNILIVVFVIHMINNNINIPIWGIDGIIIISLLTFIYLMINIIDLQEYNYNDEEYMNDEEYHDNTFYYKSFYNKNHHNYLTKEQINDKKQLIRKNLESKNILSIKKTKEHE